MTRRYLLDTGPAQDLLFRRKGIDLRVSECRKRGIIVGTCMPVIGELFAGIEFSHSRDRNRPILARRLSLLRCWPFSRDAAERYGELFAVMRRQGTPIQQIDLQIAAICLTLQNCSLVSNDSDFAVIPGLPLETW